MIDINEKIPAISVIIPMYNVEKYIEQCLDCVLTQTFTDYEVILVDDASTDHSVDAAEKFLASHPNADKVHILKRTVNSGGAATPRNQGLGLSRGRYVTFVDADDLISRNALEVLINAARQTNADVVHAEKFLQSHDNSKSIDSTSRVIMRTYQSGDLVDKVTVDTNDITARVERFCNMGYLWNIWNKLFRRDFLIEHRIEFSDAHTIEDMIFSFSCLCCAQTYVRIPDVFYLYRFNPTSLTHSTLTLGQTVNRYVSSMSRGVKALDKFLGTQQFFIANPRLKLMAVNFLIRLHLLGESKIYSIFPAYVIEPIVKDIFARESVEGSEVLLTYLFDLVNEMHLRLNNKQIPTER